MVIAITLREVPYASGSSRQSGEVCIFIDKKKLAKCAQPGGRRPGAGRGQDSKASWSPAAPRSCPATHPLIHFFVQQTRTGHLLRAACCSPHRGRRSGSSGSCVQQESRRGTPEGTRVSGIVPAHCKSPCENHVLVRSVRELLSVRRGSGSPSPSRRVLFVLSYTLAL